MNPELKKRILNAVSDPQLQKNYYHATASALKKNRIRQETPELFEDLRQQAHDVKARIVADLESYLQQAKYSLAANGMTVHEAADAAAANSLILSILREHGAASVVKAKSMLTEELELNDFLLREGLEVNETDLGEYIIQLAGEKPSHITAPAIHKSAAQIAALFQEKLGIDYTENEQILTETARQILREKFFEADAGISGANFILTDSGSICLVENEGNIRLTTVLPRLHIVVVGIEKLLPDARSLALMMELLSYSATGQKFPGYESLISRPDEGQSIHVVFVDNGRRKLLKDEEMRVLLHCIRCGACLNTCPVYQHVGGHSYGWTYPGPIGALLTPNMRGMDGDEDLPFMSTLCGHCTAACPVKIPLHQLLLTMRQRAEKKDPVWNIAMKGFATAATHPGLYNSAMKGLRILQRIIPGEGLPAYPWAPAKFFPKLKK